MREILTLFPLKKRSAIVATLVFGLAFAVYYFVYYPVFVKSDNEFVYRCCYDDNNGNADCAIVMQVSVPLFLTNGSKVDFYIENLSAFSGSLSLTPIIHAPTTRYDTNFSWSFQPNSISVEQLKSNGSVIESLEVRAIGDAREIAEAEIVEIVGSFQNRDIECYTYSDNERLRHSYYRPLYGEMLNIAKNLPFVAWMMMFIVVGLCSFFDKGTQEFPLHSKLGRYLAMVLFFKVSGGMVLFLGCVSLAGWLLLKYWVGGYTMLVSLALYFLVSQIMRKSLLRAIDLVPTAKIVVDGSGREKDVEILSGQIKRTLKETFRR